MRFEHTTATGVSALTATLDTPDALDLYGDPRPDTAHRRPADRTPAADAAGPADTDADPADRAADRAARARVTLGDRRCPGWNRTTTHLYAHVWAADLLGLTRLAAPVAGSPVPHPP